MYAAHSPAEALKLAEALDRTATYVVKDVKAATPEDLAEVAPDIDRFGCVRYLTLGEVFDARLEPGRIVQSAN